MATASIEGASTTSSAGTPERPGVGPDALCPRRIALHRVHTVARVFSGELDAHGARTGAEVPQHVARAGREVRDGGRAHDPLAQLPVVLVGRVGQPGRHGASTTGRPGVALDADEVQPRDGTAVPRCGHAVDARLGRRAEVTEHGDVARGIPLFDEQRGDPRGASSPR